jgi:hypothetical protein
LRLLLLKKFSSLAPFVLFSGSRNAATCQVFILQMNYFLAQETRPHAWSLFYKWTHDSRRRPTLWFCLLRLCPPSLPCHTLSTNPANC